MHLLSFLLPVALVLVPVIGAQETVAPAAPAASAVSENYILQAGDVVRLQVFQEPDLDRELRVEQDGTVVLPLIGAVVAGQRTVREVAGEIARRYDADYLVNPQITLTVLKYSERRVNIMGMVNQPGPVVFPPEEKMTLLDAITRAGGFNRLGDRRRVRLTRTRADGQVEQFTINTDEILEGTAANAWPLEPGDNIFVPERRT
jgi:polysaccharide export outer membrane protein